MQKATMVMFRGTWVMTLVSFLFLLGGAYGNPLDADISQIQKTYDTIRDIQSYFVQESVVKSWSAEQVQKAEGKVFFKKHGKMFWDYQEPAPQQIISDGNTLWFYEPEDKQVTVTTIGAGFPSQISADLLNGNAQLKRDFDVTDMTSPAEGDAGKLVLQLIPRSSQNNLNKILLRLDKKTFLIYQTEVYDLFDNLTRITFSQIQIDTNLADTLFTFTPPPGVEMLAPPTIPLPRQ
jgi:outer membrane lipoprotein carrier protein